MTNVERATKFMDYIRFNFGDTELDEKFLMGYFKTQDDNKENYMELIWMSLSFLHESNGDFKIYTYNPLDDDFEKAHNIAVRVLTVVEELINDNLFEFAPSGELLYINDLNFAAELSKKIRKNPDYKLTPYEAMKVIGFLKGASYYTNDTILSTAFVNNWKAFVTENSVKIYHKAIETLNEMLKIDGYTIIEAFDDNTKSVNSDTKSKKTTKEFIETIESLEDIEFDSHDFNKLDKYTKGANFALEYIASIGGFPDHVIMPGYNSTDIDAYRKAIKLINTCVTKGYYELIPIDPTAKPDNEDEEIVDTYARFVKVNTDEEAFKESSVKFDFLYTLESDTDFYDAFVELIQYYHKTLEFKCDLFVHFINELQNKTEESLETEYLNAGIQAKCMIIDDIDLDHDEICFKENRWCYEFQFNKPEYSINVAISRIDCKTHDLDNIF